MARETLKEILDDIRGRTFVSPWMTIKESACYLKVTPRTIKSHIASGKLKHTKVRGVNRIHKTWLDVFIISGGTGKPTKPQRRDFDNLKMAG